MQWLLLSVYNSRLEFPISPRLCPRTRLSLAFVFLFLPSPIDLGTPPAMRLTSSLLLASLPGALASLSLTKESKVVKTACTTSYASTNVKSVAHHSKVETLYPPPIIVLSTSTPSTTITPRPVTFWNTVFTTSTAYTTDVAITDDYTSTSTVFETDTITSTSTYTSVETDSTTITSTSTVTIPTSAGFLPIDDTPTNAYPNQKRWVGGRAAAAALENRQPGRQPPKGLDNCREHPASVTCKCSTMY